MNIIIGSDLMKLIVGLGNPDREYDNTRHNVGFAFLDYYLRYRDINVKWQKKFEGLYVELFINGEKVVFLKPQTYMNLSGDSVRKCMEYFRIKIDDLLIINDDLDLLVGNFKLKPAGSSAGHNGLKNISENLKTDNYKRLKIGISKDKSIDTKDYVLGKFSADDLTRLESTFKDLCIVLDDYFNLPFSDLMSKYNRKNR